MSPLKRKPVSKGKSARRFKKHVGKTASANMRNAPMRGGFRF